MNYRSAHSKVIKRGIAHSCLEAALNKLCFHTVGDSSRVKCGRLKNAGIPSALISGVASTLVKKVKGVCLSKKSVDRRSTVVIPYPHKVSYNMKKSRRPAWHPSCVFCLPENEPNLFEGQLEGRMATKKWMQQKACQTLCALYFGCCIQEHAAIAHSTSLGDI